MAVVLFLTGASPAAATVLAPWGSSLGATPTMDTANGASNATNDEPESSFRPADTSDNAVATSFSPGCTKTFTGGAIPCTAWMHDATDNTLWNTSVAGGSATALQGGQVLDVKIKGCSVPDPAAASDNSVGSDGQPVPANSIEFQGLTPQAGGTYKQDSTAGGFTLPWCSNSTDPADRTAAVNTSTISTYQPLHMCLNAGDTVSFYDLGGYVPAAGGAPAAYTQGVPFMVIAPVSGSSTDSFTDAPEATYAPGQQPNGDNSGWGSEEQPGGHAPGHRGHRRRRLRSLPGRKRLTSPPTAMR